MPGTNVISKLEYKEAESKIGSNMVKKNHDILNSAVGNLEDSILICEYPDLEISPMRTKIFYVPPEFLDDHSDAKLNEFSILIDLYKNEYESLCTKLNDYIKNKTVKKLKSLYGPSEKMKNEINEIIKNFEETIKNLCGPLISEQEGLNSIDTDGFNNLEKNSLLKEKLQITEKIDKFKKESENLNKKYNVMFNDISVAVEFICINIQKIPSSLSKLQDKIEEGMSKYEETLELINDEKELNKYNKYLQKIRESIELIIIYKNQIIKKVEDDIDNLEEEYKKRRTSFISLKDKVENIIKNLETRSKAINNDILDVRKKYNQKKIELPEISISSISTVIISKVKDLMDSNMNESIEILKEEKVNIKKEIQQVFIDIESFVKEVYLDLLIILDITGSMELYFEQVRTKLKDIIGNIKKNLEEFQVNNINLGFIGYKDVEEIYKNEIVDIPFSTDLDKIMEEIDKTLVGGGDDTAEDIAYAFELALKKEWTCKAKFVVLIPDSPCHGSKYHEPDLMDNYPNGIRNRKDIEESVKELANNGVSLICIKLNQSTDIMFKIFDDIYKEVNSKNKISEFYVAKLDSVKHLADQIQSSVSKIFKVQRIHASLVKL